MNTKIDEFYRYFQQKLNTGTNLVYFASGAYIKEEYNNLPYDNIFLVDKAFKRSRKINDKLFTVALENISAVNLFKLLDIKIDCMVSINEGLGEGGGIYHINSDVFLGYVMPILADKVIHIGSIEYYSYQDKKKYMFIKHNYLDLPFNNIETLKEDDTDFISPTIFNTAYKGIVTRLKDKSTKKTTFKKSNVTVNVYHKSIWEDIDNLDACFVIFDNQNQQELFEKFHDNIYPLWINLKENQFRGALELQEIKKLINENNWASIGIIPNRCHTPTLLSRLIDDSILSLKNINFYHLNKNDFTSLYKL